MAEGLEIIYGGMLEEVAGVGVGLSAAALDRARSSTESRHAALEERRGSGQVGFFGLPGAREDLTGVLEAAAALRERFANLLVLGIGGSALGATALVRALTPAFGTAPGAMRVQCLDNVDPAWFEEAIGAFDAEKTAYCVISKSGGTPEPMSQFLVVRELLRRRFPDDWASRMVFVTDVERGALRAEAERTGARSFTIPANVGGRFSVFTPVGLLPAACAGIDITALLDGAARAQRRCDAPSLDENPGYLLGTLLALSDLELGRRYHVVMPYRQGLWETALWFRQLWAESLGKSDAVGPTPIAALGATDQHSQMQLYMEGPHDKVVVFVEVEDHGAEVSIPDDAPDALAYLAGGSLAALLRAELLGSRAALLEAGRPVLTIRLPRLDARSMGELLQTFMAATAFAGEIYEVDAFNQPGVEAGKVNAAALLGKAGLEEKAEALRKVTEEIERHRI